MSHPLENPSLMDVDVEMDAFDDALQNMPDSFSDTYLEAEAAQPADLFAQSDAIGGSDAAGAPAAAQSATAMSTSSDGATGNRLRREEKIVGDAILQLSNLFPATGAVRRPKKLIYEDTECSALLTLLDARFSSMVPVKWCLMSYGTPDTLMDKKVYSRYLHATSPVFGLSDAVELSLGSLLTSEVPYQNSNNPFRDRVRVPDIMRDRAMLTREFFSKSLNAAPKGSTSQLPSERPYVFSIFGKGPPSTKFIVSSSTNQLLYTVHKNSVRENHKSIFTIVPAIRLDPRAFLHDLIYQGQRVKAVVTVPLINFIQEVNLPAHFRLKNVLRPDTSGELRSASSRPYADSLSVFIQGESVSVANSDTAAAAAAAAEAAIFDAGSDVPITDADHDGIHSIIQYLRGECDTLTHVESVYPGSVELIVSLPPHMVLDDELLRLTGDFLVGNLHSHCPSSRANLSRHSRCTVDDADPYMFTVKKMAGFLRCCTNGGASLASYVTSEDHLVTMCQIFDLIVSAQADTIPDCTTLFRRSLRVPNNDTTNAAIIDFVLEAQALLKRRVWAGPFRRVYLDYISHLHVGVAAEIRFVDDNTELPPRPGRIRRFGISLSKITSKFVPGKDSKADRQAALHAHAASTALAMNVPSRHQQQQQQQQRQHGSQQPRPQASLASAQQSRSRAATDSEHARVAEFNAQIVTTFIPTILVDPAPVPTPPDILVRVCDIYTALDKLRQKATSSSFGIFRSNSNKNIHELYRNSLVSVITSAVSVLVNYSNRPLAAHPPVAVAAAAAASSSSFVSTSSKARLDFVALVVHYGALVPQHMGNLQSHLDKPCHELVDVLRTTCLSAFELMVDTPRPSALLEEFWSAFAIRDTSGRDERLRAHWDAGIAVLLTSTRDATTLRDAEAHTAMFKFSQMLSQYPIDGVASADLDYSTSGDSFRSSRRRRRGGGGDGGDGGGGGGMVTRLRTRSTYASVTSSPSASSSQTAASLDYLVGEQFSWSHLLDEVQSSSRFFFLYSVIIPRCGTLTVSDLYDYLHLCLLDPTCMTTANLCELVRALNKHASTVLIQWLDSSSLPTSQPAKMRNFSRCFRLAIETGIKYSPDTLCTPIATCISLLAPTASLHLHFFVCVFANIVLTEGDAMPVKRICMLMDSLEQQLDGALYEPLKLQVALFLFYHKKMENGRCEELCGLSCWLRRVSVSDLLDLLQQPVQQQLGDDQKAAALAGMLLLALDTHERTTTSATMTTTSDAISEPDLLRLVFYIMDFFGRSYARESRGDLASAFRDRITSGRYSVFVEAPLPVGIFNEALRWLDEYEVNVSRREHASVFLEHHVPSQLSHVNPRSLYFAVLEATAHAVWPVLPVDADALAQANESAVAHTSALLRERQNAFNVWWGHMDSRATAPAHKHFVEVLVKAYAHCMPERRLFPVYLPIDLFVGVCSGDSTQNLLHFVHASVHQHYQLLLLSVENQSITFAQLRLVAAAPQARFTSYASLANHLFSFRDITRALVSAEGLVQSLEFTREMLRHIRNCPASLMIADLDALLDSVPDQLDAVPIAELRALADSLMRLSHSFTQLNASPSSSFVITPAFESLVHSTVFVVELRRRLLQLRASPAALTTAEFVNAFQQLRTSLMDSIKKAAADASASPRRAPIPALTDLFDVQACLGERDFDPSSPSERRAFLQLSDGNTETAEHLFTSFELYTKCHSIALFADLCKQYKVNERITADPVFLNLLQINVESVELLTRSLAANIVEIFKRLTPATTEYFSRVKKAATLLAFCGSISTGFDSFIMVVTQNLREQHARSLINNLGIAYGVLKPVILACAGELSLDEFFARIAALNINDQSLRCLSICSDGDNLNRIKNICKQVRAHSETVDEQVRAILNTGTFSLDLTFVGYRVHYEATSAPVSIDKAQLEELVYGAAEQQHPLQANSSVEEGDDKDRDGAAPSRSSSVATLSEQQCHLREFTEAAKCIDVFHQTVAQQLHPTHLLFQCGSIDIPMRDVVSVLGAFNAGTERIESAWKAHYHAAVVVCPSMLRFAVEQLVLLVDALGSAPQSKAMMLAVDVLVGLANVDTAHAVQLLAEAAPVVLPSRADVNAVVECARTLIDRLAQLISAATALSPVAASRLLVLSLSAELATSAAAAAAATTTAGLMASESTGEAAGTVTRRTSRKDFFQSVSALSIPERLLYIFSMAARVIDSTDTSDTARQVVVPFRHILWASECTTVGELTQFLTLVDASPHGRFVLHGYDHLNELQHQVKSFCYAHVNTHEKQLLVLLESSAEEAMNASLGGSLVSFEITSVPRPATLESHARRMLARDGLRALTHFDGGVECVEGPIGFGKTYAARRALAERRAQGHVAVEIQVNATFTVEQCIRQLRQARAPKPTAPVAIFLNLTFDAPFALLNDFLADLMVAGVAVDSRSGQTVTVRRGDGWSLLVEVPAGVSRPLAEVLPIVSILRGSDAPLSLVSQLALSRESRLVGRLLAALRDGSLHRVRSPEVRGVVSHIKLDERLNHQVTDDECRRVIMNAVEEQVKLPRQNFRFINYFVRFMHRRCEFLLYSDHIAMHEWPGKVAVALLHQMLNEARFFFSHNLQWDGQVGADGNRDGSPSQFHLPVYILYQSDGGLTFFPTSGNVLSTQELPEVFQALRRVDRSLDFTSVSQHDLGKRATLVRHVALALDVDERDFNDVLVSKSYILMADFAFKLLLLHERVLCGMPLVWQGETGTGKTCLVSLYADLMLSSRRTARYGGRSTRSLVNEFVRWLGQPEAIAFVGDDQQLRDGIVDGAQHLRRELDNINVSSSVLLALSLLESSDLGERARRDVVVTLKTFLRGEVMPELYANEETGEPLSTSATQALCSLVLGAPVVSSSERLRRELDGLGDTDLSGAIGLVRKTLSNESSFVYLTAVLVRKLRRLLLSRDFASDIDNRNVVSQMQDAVQRDLELDKVLEFVRDATHQSTVMSSLIVHYVKNELTRRPELAPTDALRFAVDQFSRRDAAETNDDEGDATAAPTPSSSEGATEATASASTSMPTTETCLLSAEDRDVAEVRTSIAALEGKAAVAAVPLDSPVSILSEFFATPYATTFVALRLDMTVTEAEAMTRFRPVFRRALSCPKEVFVVFLDEMNTCLSLRGFFKSLVVDRVWPALDIGVPPNVSFVAAINPAEVGRYAVSPIGGALAEFVLHWDSLEGNKLHEYVRSCLSASHVVFDKLGGDAVHIGDLTSLVIAGHTFFLDCDPHEIAAAAAAAARASDPERHHATTVSAPHAEHLRHSVSQRDIQRVIRLAEFFHSDQISNLGALAKQELDLMINSFLLAVLTVGYLRLDETLREAFEACVANCEWVARNGGVDYLRRVFGHALHNYASVMDVPAGICPNRAFEENVFAITVCFQNGIPLSIVGEPGTSKTLASKIVISRMQGSSSPNVKLRGFKKVFCFMLHGSPDLTSRDVRWQCEQAEAKQRLDDTQGPNLLNVVVFEEADATENKDSLKVFHYFHDERRVGSLQLMNNPQDVAQSNRMLMVFRGKPCVSDLQDLALESIKLSVGQSISPRNQLQLENFCRAYSHLIDTHRWFAETFGLRDFYHLIRFLRRKCQSKERILSITPNMLIMALLRNFNCEPDHFRVIVECFLVNSKVPLSTAEKFFEPVFSVFKSALTDYHREGGNLNDTSVRPKLLIDRTHDDGALRLLDAVGVLPRDDVDVFELSMFTGSRTEVDRIQLITRIVAAMEHGRTIVMVNTQAIHASFFDLFNQHYTTTVFGSKEVFFATIPVGTTIRYYPVHPKFQCIVHMRESELHACPKAFRDRFEKYTVDIRSALEYACNMAHTSARKTIQWHSERLHNLVDELADSCVAVDDDRLRETADALVLDSIAFETLHSAAAVAAAPAASSSYSSSSAADQGVAAAADVNSTATFQEVRLSPATWFSQRAHAGDEDVFVECSQTVTDAGAHCEPARSASAALAHDFLHYHSTHERNMVHLASRLLQTVPSEMVLVNAGLLKNYLADYFDSMGHLDISQMVRVVRERAHDADVHGEAHKYLVVATSNTALLQLPHGADEHFDCTTTHVRSLTEFRTQIAFETHLRAHLADTNDSRTFVLALNMSEVSPMLLNHARRIVEQETKNAARRLAGASDLQSPIKTVVLLCHFRAGSQLRSRYSLNSAGGWETVVVDCSSMTTRFPIARFAQHVLLGDSPQLEPFAPRRASTLAVVRHLYFSRTLPAAQRASVIDELLERMPGLHRAMNERMEEAFPLTLQRELLQRCAAKLASGETVESIGEQVAHFFDRAVVLTAATVLRFVMGPRAGARGAGLLERLDEGQHTVEGMLAFAEVVVRSQPFPDVLELMLRSEEPTMSDPVATSAARTYVSLPLSQHVIRRIEGSVQQWKMQSDAVLSARGLFESVQQDAVVAPALEVLARHPTLCYAYARDLIVGSLFAGQLTGDVSQTLLTSVDFVFECFRAMVDVETGAVVKEEKSIAASVCDLHVVFERSREHLITLLLTLEPLCTFFDDVAVALESLSTHLKDSQSITGVCCDFYRWGFAQLWSQVASLNSSVRRTLWIHVAELVSAQLASDVERVESLLPESAATQLVLLRLCVVLLRFTSADAAAASATAQFVGDHMAETSFPVLCRGFVTAIGNKDFILDADSRRRALEAALTILVDASSMLSEVFVRDLLATLDGSSQVRAWSLLSGEPPLVDARSVQPDKVEEASKQAEVEEGEEKNKAEEEEEEEEEGMELPTEAGGSVAIQIRSSVRDWLVAKLVGVGAGGGRVEAYAKELHDVVACVFTASRQATTNDRVDELSHFTGDLGIPLLDSVYTVQRDALLSNVQPTLRSLVAETTACERTERQLRRDVLSLDDGDDQQVVGEWLCELVRTAVLHDLVVIVAARGVASSAGTYLTNTDADHSIRACVERVLAERPGATRLFVASMLDCLGGHEAFVAHVRGDVPQWPLVSVAIRDSCLTDVQPRHVRAFDFSFVDGNDEASRAQALLYTSLCEALARTASKRQADHGGELVLRAVVADESVSVLDARRIVVLASYHACLRASRSYAAANVLVDALREPLLLTAVECKVLLWLLDRERLRVMAPYGQNQLVDLLLDEQSGARDVTRTAIINVLATVFGTEPRSTPLHAALWHAQDMVGTYGLGMTNNSRMETLGLGHRGILDCYTILNEQGVSHRRLTGVSQTTLHIIYFHLFGMMSLQLLACDDAETVYTRELFSHRATDGDPSYPLVTDPSMRLRNFVWQRASVSLTHLQSHLSLDDDQTHALNVRLLEHLRDYSRTDCQCVFKSSEARRAYELAAYENVFQRLVASTSAQDLLDERARAEETHAAESIAIVRLRRAVFKRAGQPHQHVLSLLDAAVHSGVTSEPEKLSVRRLQAFVRHEEHMRHGPLLGYCVELYTWIGRTYSGLLRVDDLERPLLEFLERRARVDRAASQRMVRVYRTLCDAWNAYVDVFGGFAVAGVCPDADTLRMHLDDTSTLGFFVTRADTDSVTGVSGEHGELGGVIGSPVWDVMDVLRKNHNLIVTKLHEIAADEGLAAAEHAPREMSMARLTSRDPTLTFRVRQGVAAEVVAAHSMESGYDWHAIWLHLCALTQAMDKPLLVMDGLCIPMVVAVDQGASLERVSVGLEMELAVRLANMEDETVHGASALVDAAAADECRADLAAQLMFSFEDISQHARALFEAHDQLRQMRSAAQDVTTFEQSLRLSTIGHLLELAGHKGRDLHQRVLQEPAVMLKTVLLVLQTKLARLDYLFVHHGREFKEEPSEAAERQLRMRLGRLTVEQGAILLELLDTHEIQLCQRCYLDTPLGDLFARVLYVEDEIADAVPQGILGCHFVALKRAVHVWRRASLSKEAHRLRAEGVAPWVENGNEQAAIAAAHAAVIPWYEAAARETTEVRLLDEVTAGTDVFIAEGGVTMHGSVPMEELQFRVREAMDDVYGDESEAEEEEEEEEEYEGEEGEEEEDDGRTEILNGDDDYVHVDGGMGETEKKNVYEEKDAAEEADEATRMAMDERESITSVSACATTTSTIETASSAPTATAPTQSMISDGSDAIDATVAAVAKEAGGAVTMAEEVGERAMSITSGRHDMDSAIGSTMGSMGRDVSVVYDDERDDLWIEEGATALEVHEMLATLFGFDLDRVRVIMRNAQRAVVAVPRGLNAGCTYTVELRTRK